MKEQLNAPLLRSIGATVFAALLLQVAFGIFYWLPHHSVGIALRPSLDTLAIVTLVLAASLVPGRPERTKRILTAFLAPVIGVSILLGVAQGIALRNFGYDFTLAYHMEKVKALINMMYDAQSILVFFLSMSGLAIAIAAVVSAGVWAVRRIFTAAKHSQIATRTLASVLVLYTFIGLLLGFNGPVTAEVVSQIGEALHREERIEEQAEEITKKMKTAPPIQFGEEVKRPTVLVFVVESYGNILFEAKKYRAFHEVIKDAEARLLAKNYSIRSNTYQAPVFGGSSWLANATILCRLMIPTEKIYFSLFKTQTRCLPRPFNEAGYHSVFAGSNTTEIPEDYATLFPFESFHPRDSYDYKGPRMSWSYMPDQYIIDQMEKQVLSQPSERPRFVYYKLSSSHHPWDTIPPFIKDWSEVGDGSIYHEVKPKRYPDNGFLGGRHLNEGYYDSIVYSLETIVSYLDQLPEDREFVAILLGDHQPRRPVADMDKDPWTVPLHVISRDKELVDRFEHLGYGEGLFTTSKAPLAPGLELFADHLFRVLNDTADLGATRGQ